MGEHLALGVPSRRPLALKALIALASGRAFAELIGWALIFRAAGAARTAGGFDPPALHGARLRPDMDFRGAVKQHGGLAVAARFGFITLRNQAPMINPCVVPRPFQGKIGLILPGGAPFPQQRAAVPFSCFHLVQARFRRLTQGEHDMRMKILWMIATRGHGVMQSEVRHHAPAGELGADIRLHQLTPCLSTQFVRQGKVDFTGELRVGAALHPLHRVPQLLAVGQPQRPTLGHDDLAVGDALLAAVILRLAAACVMQLLACPVGCRCHGVIRFALGRSVQVLTTLPPAQHLRAKMVNRHAVSPSTDVARWSPTAMPSPPSCHTCGWLGRGGAPMLRSNV